MNYLTNYYKNLSEQLQERVNYLQKLLKEESGMSDKLMLHKKIAMDIAKHHSSVAPHIARNLGSSNYDQELSRKNLEKELMDPFYLKNPFTSHEDALMKMDGQYMPDVINVGKGNPHWNPKHDVVIEIGTPSGHVDPYKVELVHDRILSSIENEQKENEEPDYDSDPPEAEDAQAFMRRTGQNTAPRSRGEGGGISPHWQ